MSSIRRWESFWGCRVRHVAGQASPITSGPRGASFRPFGTGCQGLRGLVWMGKHIPSAAGRLLSPARCPSFRCELRSELPAPRAKASVAWSGRGTTSRQRRGMLCSLGGGGADSCGSFSTRKYVRPVGPLREGAWLLRSALDGEPPPVCPEQLPLSRRVPLRWSVSNEETHPVVSLCGEAG